MSNVLKMAEIQEIRALLSLGWPHRRVAREVHVSRTTVAAYAKSDLANCAISIPGSAVASSMSAKAASSHSEECAPLALDEADEPKPSVSIPGTTGRRSHCVGLEEFLASGSPSTPFPPLHGAPSRAPLARARFSRLPRNSRSRAPLSVRSVAPAPSTPISPVAIPARTQRLSNFPSCGESTKVVNNPGGSHREMGGRTRASTRIGTA